VIVVGVDPGARDTGLVLIDTAPPTPGHMPRLIGHVTIHNDGPSIGEGGAITVPRTYLAAVLGSILDAIHDDRAPMPVALIAVEGLRRPSWHVQRGSSSGRGGAAADPSAVVATGIVLGAVLGRQWTVPIVEVDPRGNGRAYPLDRYPAAIATKGKGNDKRRHERSAYDVAAAGPLAYRLEKAQAKGIR
jgi:hypothetical protein